MWMQHLMQSWLRYWKSITLTSRKSFTQALLCLLKKPVKLAMFVFTHWWNCTWPPSAVSENLMCLLSRDVTALNCHKIGHGAQNMPNICQITGNLFSRNIFILRGYFFSSLTKSSSAPPLLGNPSSLCQILWPCGNILDSLMGINFDLFLRPTMI